MTNVIKSENVNGKYLTIEQEKFGTGYAVTESTIIDGMGYGTEKRYYPTLAQAKRRFASLRKKYQIRETEKMEKTKTLERKDLRIGSVLEDLNGSRHTVIRFDGIFIITTYGNGENWLVPSHLATEKLIKY